MEQKPLQNNNKEKFKRAGPVNVAVKDPNGKVNHLNKVIQEDIKFTREFSRSISFTGKG